MGVITDYFSAPSDEAAATVLRDEDAGPPPPSFDTLTTNGIDPCVMLGQLEALLTGTSYEQVIANPRHCKDVQGEAELEKEDPALVIAVTDSLQRALVSADDATLESAALAWSQIEEFSGQGDAKGLASWLRELAALARRASEKSERLYCLWCA